MWLIAGPQWKMGMSRDGSRGLVASSSSIRITPDDAPNIRIVVRASTQPKVAQAMEKLAPNSGRDEGPGVYLVVLLSMLLVFTALTFLAVSNGSPGDVADRPRLLTTLAAISGPFTGAVARHGQSCCMAFSWRVAMWLAPALAVGLAAPFAVAGRGAAARSARLSLWTIGWLAWLMGGPISFLHAFG